MEVKEEGSEGAVWRLAVCQCCLTEGDGTFHDLSSSVEPSEATSSASVTYTDLLSACFSIQPIPAMYEIDQYFICEPCGVRLKESFSFRCQIEDSQLKLKNAFSKLRGDKTDSPDLKENQQCDSPFKLEPPSDDEDADPIFESIDLPRVESHKPRNRIIIRSRRAGKKDKQESKSKKKPPLPKPEESIEVTPDNAYEIAIQNLLNSTSEDADKTSEKKRNIIKIMSKNDYKNYRRLYYRVRYAKSIPFKLDETALECDICNKSFNTHKMLVSHMGIHYPNHICDLCGKSFAIKEQLVGHMRTHSTEKKICPICNKELKKSSMTRHLRTHTGNNEVYACPSCPERFVSFSTRINHMAKFHNVDIFRYSCTMCSKKFHLSSSLSKHIRRCHFQELNAKCLECGKGFFDNKALKNHMLKHTKEKKYQCEVCLKSYGRKYTIREHMKIHNNVKEHKCPLCQKSFVQKCSLKKHLNVHSTEITIKNEEL